MPLIYTLVCARVYNEKGDWISGCGMGWNSAIKGVKCYKCGKPTQLRSTFGSSPIRVS